MNEEKNVEVTARPEGWAEAYKATLKFIRSMASLGAMVFVAWLIIPKMGGFFRWMGGLSYEALCLLILGPILGPILGAAILLAVIFRRGEGLIEKIVNSNVAREAVRMKVKIKDGTDEVEVGAPEGPKLSAG